MNSLVKDILRLLFWYPLRWIVRVAPRCVIMFLAARASTLLCVLARERYGTIVRELKLCLPGEADRTINRKSRLAFRNFLQDQCDVLLYPFLTAETTVEITHIEGLEHLDRSREGGKGVILLLCHLGSNQMVLPALGFRNYPIGQVSLPADSVDIVFGEKKISWIHHHILRLKRRYEEMLPTQHLFLDQGIWQAISWLRDGNILAIAADGRHGQRFHAVPWLHRVMRLSPSPIIMHLRTGADILPTFVIRDTENRHRIVIESPLPPAVADGPRDSRIHGMLSLYAERLEAWFNHVPEQYGMFLYLAATHTSGMENALFEDWLD